MNMLDTLNLVRGAVNDRNLVSVLTHFCIHEGQIYGSNGKMSIQAPFPILREEPIIVNADKFLKAVDKCDGDPIFEIVDEHLILRSKRRKARKIRLPLSTDVYAKPIVSGKRYELEDGYRAAIIKVRDFVSKDASRPWAMGVLHMNDHLYATNNVVLVRTKYSWPPEFPVFGLPGFTVDELCRISLGLSPKYLWHEDNAIAFEFEDGIWLRSVLYAANWPDVEKMIPDMKDLPELPSDMREVTEDLVPFNEDDKFPIVQFKGRTIKTLDGGMVAEDELAGEVAEAAFHAIPLQMVLSQAERMDLSPYPKPCPWLGRGLEGIIIGVRT